MDNTDEKPVTDHELLWLQRQNQLQRSSMRLSALQRKTIMKMPRSPESLDDTGLAKPFDDLFIGGAFDNPLHLANASKGQQCRSILEEEEEEERTEKNVTDIINCDQGEDLEKSTAENAVDPNNEDNYDLSQAIEVYEFDNPMHSSIGNCT